MRFVEFTDRAGGTVLVNAAGVLFLRAAGDDGSELHLAGRAAPLLVAAPLDEAVRALEEATAEPLDPTLALVS